MMKDLHWEYMIEAQRMRADNLRVILDATEMCTDWFTSCENDGTVQEDSLGFLWYPMHDSDITARDVATAQLDKIWIDA
jgi:hypothetical protein